jgi:hypothetical protein
LGRQSHQVEKEGSRFFLPTGAPVGLVCEAANFYPRRESGRSSKSEVETAQESLTVKRLQRLMQKKDHHVFWMQSEIGLDQESRRQQIPSGLGDYSLEWVYFKRRVLSI